MQRKAWGASLLVVAVAVIAGGQLMKGQETLPVARGAVSTPKLPADLAAARVAFETATFGLG